MEIGGGPGVAGPGGLGGSGGAPGMGGPAEFDGQGNIITAAVNMKERILSFLSKPTFYILS